MTFTIPVFKYGSTFTVSTEELASARSWNDPRYNRKVKETIVHPPTQADWDEYREGVAMLKRLRKNKFYQEGGPDEGSSVDKPRARHEYVYGETHDEWLERVRELLREESDTR